MKFLNAAVLMGSLLALSGCGGGGDSGTTTSPAPTPTSSGVLSDSPVGGVQYTTSGGYSGVTDANGQYKYNPGETVTFKIGAITLGTVTATGTVTPIQLAGADGTSSNKVINLLVLLQSLDADNDPANGITINAATQAAAANAGSLDLTQAPTQFATTGNTILSSILSSAGLPRTAPVDPATAQAHFKEQFFKQLKGSWTATTAGRVIVVSFDGTGKYVHGEIGTAEGGGMSGTEVGQIDWDPVSGAITLVPSSIEKDTNGEWGLSHIVGTVTAQFDGDKLVLTDKSDSSGSATLARMTSDAANPLVGTWVLNETGTTFPAVKTQTFTFFSNGKYMMADPVGDTEAIRENRTPCSTGGIEYGDYTFNVATGNFAVSTKPAVDTNDCAGAWDFQANSGSSFTMTFNADKSSFSFEGMTAFRVTN